MKRVYGIDLGTTYSCIAWVDEHGKPALIPNSEGDMTTPSVVYFETPGNLVVGQTAKDVAKVYEERVVSTIKRATRILFIEDGSIAESGTHTELLRMRGRYYQLYTRQFRQEMEETYDLFRMAKLMPSG